MQDGQPARKRARQGASSSRPAAAAAAQEPVELEHALQGFQLREVALFLRLVYHPEDAEPGRLQQELISLGGAARLAHQLNAPGVLKNLAAAMLGKGESRGLRAVRGRG